MTGVTNIVLIIGEFPSISKYSDFFQHCPVRNLHLLVGWATCYPTLLSIDGQQVAHPTFSKQEIAKVKVMASLYIPLF